MYSGVFSKQDDVRRDQPLEALGARDPDTGGPDGQSTCVFPR